MRLGPTQIKILGALSADPKSAPELRKAAGVNQGTIYLVLKALVKGGFAVRVQVAAPEKPVRGRPITFAWRRA